MSNLRTLSDIDEDGRHKKTIYAIVFIAGRGPDSSYMIFSEEDILFADPCCLKENSKNFVRKGRLFYKCTIVKASYNLMYLEVNCEVFTKIHQDSIEKDKEDVAAAAASRTSKCEQFLEENMFEMNADSVPTNLTEVSQTQYIEYMNTYSSLLDIEEIVELEMSNKTNSEVTNKANHNQGEQNKNEYDEQDKENVDIVSETVIVGSNGTNISKDVYDSIDWTNYETATKGLLMALFSKEVLSTHNIPGKMYIPTGSRGRKMRRRLNGKIVRDMVQLVTGKYLVGQHKVRQIIAEECASLNLSERQPKRIGDDEKGPSKRISR